VLNGSVPKSMLAASSRTHGAASGATETWSCSPLGADAGQVERQLFLDDRFVERR
jgi:hypothetical protein